VFLCLGIYVSPLELMEAASGIAILVGLVMAASGVMMLFDDRVMRIAIGGLRSFSTVVIALFLVVLVFSAGLLAFGALFGLIRTLFNIDSVDASNEE
jgi:ABC-type tungstate transport system substrate-binding protein